MGTRGAFGFLVDGETKVTYNHWDSYPSGLGQDLVDTLTEILDEYSFDWLCEKARKLQFVPNRGPTEEEIARLRPWTDLSVSERSTSDWYCLLRNAQGDLRATLRAGLIRNSVSFLSDSLFCEFAYVINLDDNLFEIYKGFQKDPHQLGRYHNQLTKDFDERVEQGRTAYYPVALQASLLCWAVPLLPPPLQPNTIRLLW